MWLHRPRKLIVTDVVRMACTAQLDRLHTNASGRQRRSPRCVFHSDQYCSSAALHVSRCASSPLQASPMPVSVEVSASFPSLEGEIGAREVGWKHCGPVCTSQCSAQNVYKICIPATQRACMLSALVATSACQCTQQTRAERELLCRHVTLLRPCAEDNKHFISSCLPEC